MMPLTGLHGEKRAATGRSQDDYGRIRRLAPCERNERHYRTILAPSGFRTIRTASHRARTGIAPPRTIRTVRALAPLAPVPIKAPCSASARAGAISRPGNRGSALTDQQPRVAHVAGLRAATLQRPTSWSDAAAMPSIGAWCSCCRGQRWWCEARDPKGWRCAQCHPPSHLPADAVREMRT